jgi:hypothetical protein
MDTVIYNLNTRVKDKMLKLNKATEAKIKKLEDFYENKYRRRSYNYAGYTQYLSDWVWQWLNYFG